MILKEGTKFSEIDSAILVAACVADGLWQELGVTTGVTLTSGTDGQHSAKSLHYPSNSPSGKCRAVDLRIWNVPSAHEAADKLRKRLTNDYDVVLESTHIHVEFDPNE